MSVIHNFWTYGERVTTLITITSITSRKNTARGKWQLNDVPKVSADIQHIHHKHTAKWQVSEHATIILVDIQERHR